MVYKTTTVEQKKPNELTGKKVFVTHVLDDDGRGELSYPAGAWSTRALANKHMKAIVASGSWAEECVSVYDFVIDATMTEEAADADGDC